MTMTNTPRGCSAQWIAVSLMVLLAGCGSAPKPVMPDGGQRIPVNDADRVAAFKAKLADEQRVDGEQVRLTREMEAIKAQIAQLKAATIVLAADAEGKAGSPLARTATTDLMGAPSVRVALERPAVPGVVQPPPEVPSVIEHRAPTLVAAPGVPLVQPISPVSLRLDASGSKDRPARLVIATPPSDQSAADSRMAQGLQAKPMVGPGLPARDTARVIRTVPTIHTSDLGRVAQAPEESRGASTLAVRPTSLIRQPTGFSSADLESPARAVRSPQEPPMPRSPRLLAQGARLFEIEQPEPGTAFTAPQAASVKLLEAARRADRIVIRPLADGSQGNAQAERDGAARAEQVRLFLLEQGIAPQRIWMTGTEIHPALARRMQIEIVRVENTEALLLPSPPTDAPNNPATTASHVVASPLVSR